ncbi:hypothetical protein HMPREF1084_01671 [Clostridium butyricum 60E.3]|uniref:glycosyltransferase family 4 protein n=1 Tax=Clostridium butyricum TaxID=1492 RepID=UPI0002D1E8BF|nr:glycosyltransferase family 4 protein [Clostridium butyricum]ENZ34382.1 hypothetical protein HMPREF1084_01671 [Clostridium butyricum 60E.3]
MNGTIKVLQVGSDINVKGGIATVINTYINYSWSKDVKLFYLVTHKEGSVFIRALCFVKALIIFPFKVIKNDVDIVHIHMSENGSFFRKYILLKFSKMMNRKVIIHMHGAVFHEFYYGSNKIIKNMINNLFSNADKIIVLGKNWGDFVRSITPNANVFIAGNPVKVNCVSRKVDNNFNIIFIGYLEKRKGVDVLIKSIPYLKKQDKNINVYICGDGPEKSNLETLVKKLGLCEMVNFEGWIDIYKKKEILKKANLLVFPSRNEGLPMAILESLGYGIPVISTNVGSIADVIKENYNGYFVEIGDYENIAKLTNVLIENEEKYKEMSKNAFDSIMNSYEEGKYFNDIKKLYFKLVY